MDKATKGTRAAPRKPRVNKAAKAAGEATGVVAEYHVVAEPVASGATTCAAVEQPDPARIQQAAGEQAATNGQHHVIMRLKPYHADDVSLQRQASNAFDDDSLSTAQCLLDIDATACDKARTVPGIAGNQAGGGACFWCCHPCDGPPVGLPVKVKDGKFCTCGCFCSFECAAAFNFNSKELHQDPWASYELLNKMAHGAGHSHVVHPAPSRFCLRMFGGWMGIKEFRSRAPAKVVAPLPAPMMSIVQYMEEIMSSDIMHGTSPSHTLQSFVPLDQDRVQRAKQNLLMTQSHKAKKNTIHEKMNLTSRTTGDA